VQESSCVRQLSSISSQDSGFVSHDVVLSSDYNQDVSSQSMVKVRYSADIPLLRCKLLMLQKFTNSIL